MWTESENILACLLSQREKLKEPVQPGEVRDGQNQNQMINQQWLSCSPTSASNQEYLHSLILEAWVVRSPFSPLMLGEFDWAALLSRWRDLGAGVSLHDVSLHGISLSMQNSQLSLLFCLCFLHLVRWAAARGQSNAVVCTSKPVLLFCGFVIYAHVYTVLTMEVQSPCPACYHSTENEF